MLPPDQQTTSRSTPEGSAARTDQDQDLASANAHDQMLLKALQAFIVPHVGASGDASGKNELNNKLCGPEAAKLLTALKGFIMSIIGAQSSKSDTKPIVEVSFDEDYMMTENIGVDDEVVERVTTCIERTPQTNDDAIAAIGNAPDQPEPSFHDKVLAELREHVFNKMPIRLLCFEPHGSRFRISLIERGEIYSYLVRIMQSKSQAPDYRPLKKNDHGLPFETDYLAIERIIEKYAGYAILSHTWLHTAPGEVTYSAWNKGLCEEHDPGYQKLVNFCKTAWNNHGLTLGWMDTICINKDSSSELDESIRSMYNWYRRAQICIIYLAGTYTLSDIHRDPWFTRGWTLQELLAPKVAKFYDRNWKQFGRHSDNDKPVPSGRGDPPAEIIMQLEKATTISETELTNIHLASLSRRMQLAASRKVTREEDMAYSLMGIFDISIATAYGEGGERAFTRLFQEILNSTSMGILDLFNWAGADYSFSSHLLPRRLQQYMHRSPSIDLKHSMPLEPLTWTPAGIHIPLLLIPGISIQDVHAKFEAIGDYSAVVNISPITRLNPIPPLYRLLDTRVSSADFRCRNTQMHQCTFAVLNIGLNIRGIHIPQICIAIPMRCAEDAGKVTSSGGFGRIFTEVPVVFKLGKKNMQQADHSATNYEELGKDGIVLERDDLGRHGMQLVFKYM